MPSVGVRAGRYTQYVALDAMSTPAGGDGDGGYTETATPLSPAHDWAWVAPAPTVQERRVNSTVESRAALMVRMRYRSDVTTKTRITAGSRVLYVRGVANPDTRNIELELACEEATS